jgi:hypothetical protein
LKSGVGVRHSVEHTTDSERAVSHPSVSPGTEGRLSKDEYDARLDSALSARTYADLDQVVTDLPVAPATVVTTAAKTNGLAIASLACGLAQFAFGPLATIPAIVCGHMARSQIKRTGEQGAGLALAGLTLGRTAVILGILFIVLGLAISIRCTAPCPCTEQPSRSGAAAAPARRHWPAPQVRREAGAIRCAQPPSRADYTP